MVRNIIISEIKNGLVEDLPVEIVERKGIGHPDSICDGIAESVSQAYSKWCIKKFGTLLHHNFDKVQLVAGETEVGFGKGKMVKKIKIQIAGRGTPSYKGKKIPIKKIAEDAAKDYIKNTFKYLDPKKHCDIKSYAGKGSAVLVSAVWHVESNDTSFGVSHWPYSNLEQVVFDTTNYINTKLLNELPIGEDVKVMGLRYDNNIVITCAIPFISTKVKSPDQYKKVKDILIEKIKKYSSRVNGSKVTVNVNAADNYDRGDYYLTLTGTSAEGGDDGSVGRGNRVTGFIAPFRPASLEAAAGKNPISHVGKIYNALAKKLARDIVESVKVVKSTNVYILSKIGSPLDDPLVLEAEVKTANGISNKVRELILEIINNELDNIPALREELIKGKISLF